MSTKAQRKARRRERKRQSNKQAPNNQEAPPAPPAEPLAPEKSVNAEKPGDDDDTTKPDRTKKQPKRRFGRYAFWQLIFSASLVIFTLGQVIVGYWQWDATDKQWEVMRLDQRPWLSFDVPEIAPPGIPDTIHGTIQLKNVGKTPAIVTGYAVAVQIKVSDGGQIVFQNDDVLAHYPDLGIDIDNISTALHTAANATQHQAVLAPGASTTYNVIDTMPLNDEDIGVLSENGVIIVIAYAEYLDTSKSPHKTRTCFVYGYDSGKCRMHPQYNYMD